MIGWIENQLAAAIAELAKEPPVGHLYANGIGFIPTVKGTEGPGYGWRNAIVVEVNGDMLTPHWRDFPWQENVVQHRSAVALIRPSA